MTTETEATAPYGYWLNPRTGEITPAGPPPYVLDPATGEVRSAPPDDGEGNSDG